MLGLLGLRGLAGLPLAARRLLGARGTESLPFFQRKFNFLVLVGETGHVVAEHVGADDPQRPPARLIALAEARAVPVEGVVALLLVGEAAEETAADAGHLGGIEEEILLLGHAYGDGSELPQVPAAAADHAAVAHGADHLGFVAHADLPELDAHAVLVHKILDEFAEVDAGGRRKVEDELAAVEEDFHVHELHVEMPAVHAVLPEIASPAGQHLIGLLLLQIGFCGPANHVRQGIFLEILEIGMGTGDNASQGLPLIHSDHGPVSAGEFLVRLKIAGLGKLMIR